MCPAGGHIPTAKTKINTRICTVLSKPIPFASTSPKNLYEPCYSKGDLSSKDDVFMLHLFGNDFVLFLFRKDFVLHLFGKDFVLHFSVTNNLFLKGSEDSNQTVNLCSLIKKPPSVPEESSSSHMDVCKLKML